jgi:hypothetical protein
MKGKENTATQRLTELSRRLERVSSFSLLAGDRSFFIDRSISLACSLLFEEGAATSLLSIVLPDLV